MSDQTTTLAELRAAVQRFVDERDWRQFHTPKNLSMAIAIESAELMEHFQWVGTEESRGVRESPDDLGPGRRVPAQRALLLARQRAGLLQDVLVLRPDLAEVVEQPGREVLLLHLEVDTPLAGNVLCRGAAGLADRRR